MAETVLKRKRSDPSCKQDEVYGTTTITISDANTSADSSAITLDPKWSSTPTCHCGVLAVTRTGSPANASIQAERKSGASATSMTFTAYASAAPGAGKSFTVTVWYRLLGTMRET